MNGPLRDETKLSVLDYAFTLMDSAESPQDFTIRNFGDRLTQVGDLWAALRKAKGADLRAVATYAK